MCNSKARLFELRKKMLRKTENFRMNFMIHQNKIIKTKVSKAITLITMPPKAQQPKPVPVEPVNNDVNSDDEEEVVTVATKKDWSKFEMTGLYVDCLGTQETVEIEGRQADLYSISAVNCVGKKFIIQAWGTYSFAFAEYMK
jgi:hypothetical protein